ncbi:MAG: LysR family transcriptional regulator [Mogibacterium sp.]|nr:LysR family transcriptional regulator [Mogibacterium sp.]
MKKKEAGILHPAVKLMFVSENKFFGPGPVSLLREIDICGNVRDACERCGFSYSKGWTILKRCEEELGYKIVERQAGGQSGGAAKVTEKGHRLMAVYDELEAELSKAAARRFPEIAAKHGL